jgi:hypothetical protein
MAPGIKTRFAEGAAGLGVLICCATDGHISTKAASNIADASARLNLFIELAPVKNQERQWAISALHSAERCSLICIKPIGLVAAAYLGAPFWVERLRPTG